MKILVDGRVLKHKHFTGVENYTDNVVKNLINEYGYEVAIPRFSNKYFAHLWEHCILPIKARHFDILFCPANIAPLFLPKKTKLILTIHDTFFMHNDSGLSRVFQMYYRFVIPRVAKKAAAIITVSCYSKEMIVRDIKIEASKIYAVHISHSFQIIEKQRKEKYILYVGSLNKRKNIANLLKGYFLLNTEYSLYIVGRFGENFSDDLELKELLDRARSDKKIIFLEDIPTANLQEIYAKAYMFVFPSFAEGFGIPLLEAMASQTPIVTSRETVAQEVCKDAAIYIDPKQPSDIANSINKLLQNKELCEHLQNLGVERVKHFSWAKTTSEYKKIFNAVYGLPY